MLAQDCEFSFCRIVRSALVSALIVIMTNHEQYAAAKPWHKSWNKAETPYYYSEDTYQEPWFWLESIAATSKSNESSSVTSASSVPAEPSKGKGKKGKGKRAKGISKGKNGKNKAERTADDRWEEAARGWKETKTGT